MALDQIDGLSPEASDKLKAIGIEKLMDLRLTGKTPEGRTTVWLLRVNTGDRLRWRELLLRLGLLE